MSLVISPTSSTAQPFSQELPDPAWVIQQVRLNKWESRHDPPPPKSGKELATEAHMDAVS